MTTEKIVKRVEARTGYDLWSDTYDRTPNPVVHMDARHTLKALAPKSGEWILDAGCGTGRNLGGMMAAGSTAVGMDFSLGMLTVARSRRAHAPLAQANLEQPLPFTAQRFDAVLCALVGEHLSGLSNVFREVYRVLKPGGRFVFSVYHPRMAAAGSEARFQRDGVEYRLGAIGYTVADYVNCLSEAGFTQLTPQEFRGDAQMVAAAPAAAKYLDFPVLLVVAMQKPSRQL